MSFPARSVLSLSGAAGAILTCFAVVLNVGDVGTVTKREWAQAKLIVSSTFVERYESAEVPRLERQPLIVETTPLETAPVQQVETAPVQQAETAPTQPVESAPLPEPAVQPSATIVGIWVPDAGTCSVRNFRDGFLPTVINMDGAWAGETFCVFSNQKQTETGWKVAANCSNSREQWSTQVRLTVKGDRLKWTSKRGTQDYTRCAPDFLLAKAH
jgi:hypothetical protein